MTTHRWWVLTVLAWIVDVDVLCFAGLLLPAGALGDRLGRSETTRGSTWRCWPAGPSSWCAQPSA